MKPNDIERDPKLRAAYDMLDEQLDAWAEHCAEIGVERASAIALIGEQLALRLGFHIMSLRLNGDEHVTAEDGAAAYATVARELSIATRLCLVQQGERPIERVRAAIRKATEGYAPSTYGRGATWALAEFERLTARLLDAPTV